MKQKERNRAMAIMLIFMLIISLPPDTAVALENNITQTKTTATLNGEINLDFHESGQTGEGVLETDGYHWEETSKTLTINGMKKFGTVILPQNCEVTVNVQGEDNYIANLQSKNKDSADAPTKIIFSGKGKLAIEERINLSGADNSSFTVENGVELTAKNGIGIGASGNVNSILTVNGTLTVQTVDEADAGINAGMVKVGSTGKLTVSGNKGIALNGMNIDSKMVFENAFSIEGDGQFTADCREFGIAVQVGNCGYGCNIEDVADEDAEKMLVVSEIYLPVGYKVRVAKSRAYGNEGEEYYGCAVTIAHETADLKIDDNGRIVGSASSINIKSHNHVLTNVPSQPATCTQDGNKEYWICNECKRVYSDDQGITLISIKSTVISAWGHDFIGNFNAYDETGHWHVCKRENCIATDEVQSHSFIKYEYNNDASYFADGTETAVCDAAGCQQTDTRTKENSKLIDSTAPTGEIKVSENSFKSFVNTITFGIFYNDKYDVEITAEDNETGIEKIEYCISDTAISEADIENVEEWTAYKAFCIEDEVKSIIYAKITNKAGGITYISSNGMVIDKIPPAIIGIENGKTYCHEVTFMVSDDNIGNITIDDKTVDNVHAANYTLIADGLKHTIKASDNAGNESVCTITVNNGHTFTDYNSHKDATCMKDGTETALCDFCDETNTRAAAGSKHNHTMTYHEANEATCTREGNIEYWSCSECGKNYDSENDGSILDNVKTAVDPNHHNLVYHKAEEAACEKNGNKEYWNCKDCGRYFADEDAAKELTDTDITILALGHDFTGAFNAYDKTGHWHVCKRENCTATDEVQHHSFTKYNYNNDASYFADGTETAVCDFCDETDTRTAVGSNHNHTMIYHKANEATCTKEGNIEYWSCSECGKNYDSENGGNILDNVKTAVDPNHHNLVYHKAEETACEKNGSKEYWHCEDCGRYFADEDAAKELTDTDIILPAAGHSYGEPVFNWSADGETCKVTFTCKNDGTHTITVDGKITSVITTNATCTKNGIASYTITVEFENKIYTDTKDIIIPPIPHNIEIRNSRKETCINEGYTGDKFCTICGEIIEKSMVIPKLSHSYKDGKCTVCGLTDPDFKPDELINSPQTSSGSNLTLWIALLFMAGGFSAGAAVYGKKKKQDK